MSGVAEEKADHGVAPRSTGFEPEEEVVGLTRCATQDNTCRQSRAPSRAGDDAPPCKCAKSLPIFSFPASFAGWTANAGESRPKSCAF